MSINTAERKKNLSLVKKQSGVALIVFDADSKFNSLGSNVNSELNELLDYIDNDKSIKAVIVISGKVGSFVIGADLAEIRKANSKEELLNLSCSGQKLFNRLESFPKPVVVAINGACLGGGLELALACHYRLATTSEKTIFGLPETKLGIIPGLGGTQRLPQKVGLKKALEMILQAETISSQEALRLGLVDELCNEDDLIEKAENIACNFKKENDKNLADTEELSTEKALKLLAVTERAVKLRTKGHYPAQIEAIAALREGILNGFEAGLNFEAEKFAELVISDVSANLMSLFFSTDFAKQSASSMINKYCQNRLSKIAIIGAGTMGLSIAILALQSGLEVFIKTSSEKKSSLRERITHELHKNKGKSNQSISENVSDRQNDLVNNLTIVDDIQSIQNVELVVECVLENFDIKLKILQELSDFLPEECILVSNTSALSITKLASFLKNPANFLGVHFFHPVEKMPLVEIISHKNTSKRALASGLDLVCSLNKTPVAVKDSPGFLINRLLVAYFFELARIADEQIPLNWAEEALVEFGMPMGPLQLLDEVGIDVAFAVGKTLQESLGASMQPPDNFRLASELGMHGKRNNLGFYIWENNEKKISFNPELVSKIKAVISDQKCPDDIKEHIVNRMIFVMIDEACRCLEEKIVAKPREIDYAVILGLGFPAFRGGLLKYADKVGLSKILEFLESMYKTQAHEREASSLLKKYVETGRGFYSLSGNSASE